MSLSEGFSTSGLRVTSVTLFVSASYRACDRATDRLSCLLLAGCDHVVASGALSIVGVDAPVNCMTITCVVFLVLPRRTGLDRDLDDPHRRGGDDEDAARIVIA